LKVGVRLLLGSCTMAAVLGAYASVRLSYADWLFHQNTTGCVKEAVRLDPGNGQYHAWLAELLDNEGEEAGGGARGRGPPEPDGFPGMDPGRAER
jgi:hypothetical protein